MTVSALFIALTQTSAQNVSGESVVKPENQTKVNGPVATYDKTTYEFGDLIQGTPGIATFTLTNDGNEPLIIASAKASCGCTSPSYSKDPILPGKSITISVIYNAAAMGVFLKTVSVITNAASQPVILQIKGKVGAKP